MKKVRTSLLAIGFIATISILGYYGYTRIAAAETDSEDQASYDDGGHFDVINTSPTAKATQKKETKTITTKLSDTVTQQVTTTTQHDSDGDGLFDDTDPHPTINEYFIVKDDNLDGIDDQYESTK